MLRTSDGSTPLLIACATGARVDVLRLLIKRSSDPKALASACDVQGRTPLLELLDWYNIKGRWKVKPVAPALDKIMSEEELSSWMSLRFFWARILVVLGAAAGIKCGSILHDAAAASAAVPPILSRLFCRIRWHTYDASIREERSIALPLHRAIYHNPDVVAKWRKVMFYNNAYFVRQILSVDPRAAALMVQVNDESSGSTFRRQNALCTAIAYGLGWWGSDETESNIIPGVIQTIWEATPDALVRQDEITGLYPFMLAASRPLYSTDCDRTTVESTYSLLRLSPQLIHICVGDS